MKIVKREEMSLAQTLVADGILDDCYETKDSEVTYSKMVDGSLVEKDAPSKMEDLRDAHLEMLQNHKYKIFEVCIGANFPGYIVVFDPIYCSSNCKQWTEFKKVTLRTPQEVIKFISDRN